MSQKGVVFFKILIYEFSGFFWNLFRFFLGIFSEFISLKIAKRGCISPVGTTELMWRTADTWRGHASPHGCHVYTRGRLRGTEGLQAGR